MRKKKVQKDGTKHIKGSFSNLLSLANPLIDALEDDGKISLAELFMIAPRLVLIPKLIENVKGSLAEYKNLTAAEAKEVADFIKVEFSIPNEALEDHIETGLDLVVEGYDTVTRSIQWYAKAHKWVDDFKHIA